ncbi:MAG: branched-chain amino acid transport system ATP-binding protein livF [Acidimicrobiaceae bacterium]|jgi:branched-chain amino acid transport system ATP-binding protein
MNTLRKRLDEICGGMPTFPLSVLFLLFFFDEFDTAAFNVLAPNIRDEFHLTTLAFGSIVVVNLTVVLLLAVPVGFYGDRLPRRKLVIAGAVIAGVFSFLTGLAPVLGLLILFRLGNGVGRLLNDSIHNSLLSDYYMPIDRPRVFAAHRNAVYFGTIVGSAVAGVAAVIGGWRLAFVVVMVPIVITALVGATKLKDPIRGGTDDPDAALSAEEEEPVAFAEARRILFSIKTLKRQYAAWFFLGAGLIPLAYLLPLYLEEEFGVNELGRGVIGAVNAAATFIGIQLAGRWTVGWFVKGMGEPLKRAGLALGFVGVGIFGFAVAPVLPMVLIIGLITSFVVGFFFPPFYATQALVSPARVRTLSFSFGSLFLVAGVWLLYFIPGLAALADSRGERWGLAVTAPYWIICGLVLRSGHKFVADDTMKSMSLLSLTAELRRERLAAAEGTGSLMVCRGVEVAYDQVQVLFGVDMEVRPGECVALLGTNGAGKSTLLKAISGVVDPIGGAIFFDGRDITHSDGVATTKAGVIQVPGGKAVFPTLTVAEHLRAGGWLYRDDPKYLEGAVKEVYEIFPRLLERRDQMAGNLSGGEQQMLALGMAFIAKPKLLMIDELSLGLAPTIVEMLLGIVRRIQQQGTAIILVEQSINVALTVADRAYFMEKGEVRFEGSTAELLERDDIVRSVFLEGASKTNGADKKTEPATARRDRDISDNPVVLDVRAIVKTFGGIRAVDDATFTLREGEIVGLIGPNGAGKTTIFDLISGFLIPDRGRILLGDIDVTNMSPDKRAWLRLGRSFQDARLVPSLTVAENIALGFERHLAVRDHIASMLGLPGVIELEEHVAWSVNDLIELMGLGAFRDKFVRELSTGSRRIVDLAMCIAHDPKVLLLDEPSSGIAQRETEALGPLLLRIQAETGCGLLVIEHDMPLITSISDRIIALELGHPIAEGTPDEVIRDPRVVSSYLGGDMATINRSGTAAGHEAKPAPAASAPHVKVRRRQQLVAARLEEDDE